MTDERMEQLLRERLAARAGDVTPDAGTWQRVERGVRRRRAIRSGVTALIAVACVAVVAAVGSRLLTAPTRVDFPPAQPGGDATPAPDRDSARDHDPLSDGPRTWPVPDAAVASTDGIAVALVTPDAGGAVGGAPDCTDRDCVQRVAVDPRSGNADGRAATVVVRAGRGCAAALRVSAISPDAPVALAELDLRDGCVGDPVFSPDGDRLAWVTDDPDVDGDRKLHVATVDRDVLDTDLTDSGDAPPLVDETTVSVAGDGRLDLIGWYLDGRGEWLLARTRDPASMVLVALGDDEEALPAPVEVTPDLVAYAQGAGASYALSTFDDTASLTVHDFTSDSLPATGVDMPEGFDLEGSPWITASTAGVLMGDGSRAWLLTRPDRVDPWVQVPDPVVHAALVGDPAATVDAVAPIPRPLED